MNVARCIWCGTTRGEQNECLRTLHEKPDKNAERDKRTRRSVEYCTGRLGNMAKRRQILRIEKNAGVGADKDDKGTPLYHWYERKSEGRNYHATERRWRRRLPHELFGGEWLRERRTCTTYGKNRYQSSTFSAQP